MTTLWPGRIAAAALRSEESRLVFRSVLDAFARPGRIVSLPAERLDTTPAVLLPMLALADLGTGIAVLDDGADWAEVISGVTSAPVARLEAARLVAATRPVTADELRTMCRGSALVPEDGALVCLSVSEVEGDGWVLSGPGIPGKTRVPGADPLRESREEAVAGFPAGIDLLLITLDGRMAGIPRSTIAEGSR